MHTAEVDTVSSVIGGPEMSGHGKIGESRPEENRTAERVCMESLLEEHGTGKPSRIWQESACREFGLAPEKSRTYGTGRSQGLRVWKKILRSVGREHY
jgi:hypothetical protein